MTDLSDFPYMEFDTFDTKGEAQRYLKNEFKTKEAYYGTIRKITKTTSKIIESKLDLSKRKYYDEKLPF